MELRYIRDFSLVQLRGFNGIEHVESQCATEPYPHWIHTRPSWKISAQTGHSKEEVKVMIRRKCWLPVMVVFTLVLVAQFPLHVRAYQDAAAAAAPAKVDWPQFALTPDKTANNTAETTINIGNVSHLQLLFSTALPAAYNPDGAPVL